MIHDKGTFRNTLLACKHGLINFVAFEDIMSSIAEA